MKECTSTDCFVEEACVFRVWCALDTVVLLLSQFEEQKFEMEKLRREVEEKRAEVTRIKGSLLTNEKVCVWMCGEALYECLCCDPDNSPILSHPCAINTSRSIHANTVLIRRKACRTPFGSLIEFRKVFWLLAEIPISAPSDTSLSPSVSFYASLPPSILRSLSLSSPSLHPSFPPSILCSLPPSILRSLSLSSPTLPPRQGSS